jgi:hypothetical protein
MNRSNKQISIDIKNGTLADTSNSTKLKELFNKRELYNNIFNNFNSNNIETIDIWNNKSLYGKINNEQQPIVPNYSKLKTISNNLNDTVFCIAPVADAFCRIASSPCLAKAPNVGPASMPAMAFCCSSVPSKPSNACCA